MLLILALLAGALSDDPAFTEGVKLYDQLEYEQAAFRFQEVAGRPDLSVEERATTFAWLGLSYAGAGQMPLARRAFVDAVVAWPEVALPVEVSPALAQLFGEAQQEGAARRASLQSSGAPPPTPAAPAAGPPMLPLIGATAGGAALVAGVALAGLSAVTFEGAKDKALFQQDAKAQLDVANLELGAAWVLMPVGVAVGAASAWFLLGGTAP